MTISFDHVIPVPLKDVKLNSNSIWGSKFEITKGEKIILNATSGKGKTTFTHILAGIRSDFEGEIKLNNRSIKSFSREEWSEIRKCNLSFLFQDLQLFPNLTVWENLKLKNNLTNELSDAYLKSCLEKLEIIEKLNVKCSILSMGQKQRVALIRSLAQPFDFLILDEPFSHLDKKNTALCAELINERCNDLNAGFLLTTLGDFYNIEYNRELNL